MMLKFCSICLISLFFAKSATAQSVVINEIMASNQSTLADATGDYADWIELYNPSGSTVDLSGYYLTDSPVNLTKHQLPQGVSIGPNGYLILWASEELSRGDTHLGFKLSASGEFVGLTAPDGTTLLDAVGFGPQRPDIAWGRKPNGTEAWSYLTPASPGSSNAFATAYAGVLDAPEFSQPAGFYTADLSLTLSSAEPGTTIYYTLDGSEPDPSEVGGSTYPYKNTYPGGFLTGEVHTYIYQTSIAIIDRSAEPNQLSLINPWYQNSFPTPTNNLFKGTVVRAAVFKPNYLSSPVESHTYFVTPQGSSRYSLPIFSIAIDERSLFDFNLGIYTAGGTFQNWLNGNPGQIPNPGTPANYQMRNGIWEKKGNFEMYDNLKDEWYSEPAELEINGGWSRGYPRKSIRVTIDGEALNENLLPDRPYKDYKSFVLRNSGQDWDQTLMRDAAVQRIMQGLPFDTQGYRPGILFLNGEYWGIQNLRERAHEDFIQQKYDLDQEDVDLLEGNAGVEEGSNAHYLAMLDFIEQNPLSDSANYAYLETQMDVENYLNYFIAEIYAGNKDWPANNIKFWRKQTAQYEPNAPYGHDGRWRWMMYDMDNSFGFTTSPGLDLFYHLLNPSGEAFPYQEWSHRLFRRILTNARAKGYFITRTADLLNTQFTSSRAESIIQHTKAVIAPEMPEHIARWQNPYSFEYWESLLTKSDCCPTGQNKFAENRPDALRDQYVNYFNMGAVHDLTIDVSDSEQGFVQVNTVEIVPDTPGVSENPYPWTGQYFQNQPVTLTAKVNPGFTFVRWLEGGSVIGTDSLLTLSLTTNRSVVAEFEPDPTTVPFDPAAYNLDNCRYVFDQWLASADSSTSPTSMRFVYMDEQDPTLSANIAGFTNGRYDYTSRSRVNGLGQDGVSFINTTSNTATNVNLGYPMGAVGGALLGLNTSGQTKLLVQWRGGTVEPNNRTYAIRLQYRVGSSGAFTDVLDGAGQPVEYTRNTVTGHSRVLGPVELPAAALDKPYVQLFWRYYYQSGSGSRSRLRLDDILVSTGGCQSVQSGDWHTTATWSCGRVPKSCDEVSIRDGHVVTVSIADAEALTLELRDNGHLDLDTNWNLKLFKLE